MLFIELIGDLLGRMLWPVWFTGKDPQTEFFWANGAAFAISAVLICALQRRLARLRIADTLVTFGLGVLSSAVGIAWGIQDGYGA